MQCLCPFTELIEQNGDGFKPRNIDLWSCVRWLYLQFRLRGQFLFVFQYFSLSTYTSLSQLLQLFPDCVLVSSPSYSHSCRVPFTDLYSFSFYVESCLLKQLPQLEGKVGWKNPDKILDAKYLGPVLKCIALVSQVIPTRVPSFVSIFGA